MRKRKIENSDNVQRLVDVTAFISYVGVGRNSAMKLGEEIGCKVRIGKRVLYDLRKADQYFNSLTGVK